MEDSTLPPPPPRDGHSPEGNNANKIYLPSDQHINKADWPEGERFPDWPVQALISPTATHSAVLGTLSSRTYTHHKVTPKVARANRFKRDDIIRWLFYD